MSNRVNETSETRGLLLIGTIGVGKTALAEEVAKVLEEKGAATALIDLDWLGWFHAADGSSNTLDRLILENLKSVWPNFRSAGAQRLVLIRAMWDPAKISAIRTALDDIPLVVVRVTASAETVATRLRRRDTGAELTEHLRQAGEMARLLDKAGLEQVQIENDDRPIREVALELLQRVGWI